MVSLFNPVTPLSADTFQWQIHVGREYYAKKHFEKKLSSMMDVFVHILLKEQWAWPTDALSNWSNTGVKLWETYDISDHDSFLSRDYQFVVLLSHCVDIHHMFLSYMSSICMLYRCLIIPSKLNNKRQIYYLLLKNVVLTRFKCQLNKILQAGSHWFWDEF